MAEQVIKDPAHTAQCRALSPIQRDAWQSNLQKGPETNSIDHALSIPGLPINMSIRQEMERSFGYDFSQVRIHSSAAADHSVRQLNARAYTAGHNIVFGADQYAPDTVEGKRLLAHELSHVVQQDGWKSEHIQRAHGDAPTTVVKTLESLEVVAQRIAQLAIGPNSAIVNLEGGPDKVISVVRNIRTGQISVGLNIGAPAKTTNFIEKAIENQKARIAAGEVNVVHTASDVVGGHAEVNALNEAIKAEEKAVGHILTADEVASTFEMHNVWLTGKRKLTTAPRCEHCLGITRGVKVTESLFKAEGGISGEIYVTQHGQATLSGGKTIETESIHGEIGGPKPVEPAPILNMDSKTISKVGPRAGPSVAESAIKTELVGIALNVLLFAVAYYINKWHAEKQVRKFNNDLISLLPEINTRLKNKEAEVAEKEKSFPLVYGNITIVYTKDSIDETDYNEGSMSIRNVAISHQNYHTSEKKEKDRDFITGVKYPIFSLTFSVPLFEEKTD